MTAAQGWVVQANSDTSGWLQVPRFGDATERVAWVDEQVAAIRGSVDAHWDDDVEAYFRGLVEAGSDRRRAIDAMTFLVWPAAAPACVIVHVGIAAYEPGDARPAPGDGLLYESSGLGPGIQVPLGDTLAGREAIGLRFVFSSATHAVAVEVEPTAPALLVGVLASVHRFVDQLTIQDPSGDPFRALPPDLLEARDDARWPDSVAG